MIVHPFCPFLPENGWNKLILGSFPSVLSRENGFYYGNARNRFWALLAGLYGEPTPVEILEKEQFLRRHGIALWDVIGSCEIIGSSDASLKNVLPNDPEKLCGIENIGAVFLNGAAAAKYYNRYWKAALSVPAFALPSTSPANARFTLAKLEEVWKVLLKY